jgi:transposase
MELRERLLKAVEAGGSVRSCAQRLMISYGCALRWVWRYARTGDRQAKRQGGYRSCCLLPHTAWLLEQIGRQPDLTLAEIRARLNQQGIRVGMATVWRFFRRHRIRFKKKSSTPKNKIGKTSRKRVRLGGTIKPSGLQTSSCSSMKPARRRT